MERDDAAAAVARIVAASGPGTTGWSERVAAALHTAAPLSPREITGGLVDAAAQLTLLIGRSEADVPLYGLNVSLRDEDGSDADVLVARDLVVAAVNDVLAVDTEKAKQRLAGLDDTDRLLGRGFFVAAEIAGELYDRCLTQGVRLPTWLRAAGEA